MTQETGWTPEQAEKPDEAGAPGGTDETPLEVLKELASDARDYATTEIALQKLRSKILGAALRDGALLVAVALFLLFGVVVALLVGMILALAPVIGAAFATVAVCGSGVAVLVVLLVIARWRVTSGFRKAFPKDGD